MRAPTSCRFTKSCGNKEMVLFNIYYPSKRECNWFPIICAPFSRKKHNSSPQERCIIKGKAKECWFGDNKPSIPKERKPTGYLLTKGKSVNLQSLFFA